MDLQQLNITLINKLSRRIWLIIILSIILAGLLAFYAMRSPITYTSTASVFPLTTTESSSNSVISALVGGGGSLGKNFTEENSVNILDLAQSRSIREEIAATKIPEKNNQTIAQLILAEYQSNQSFFSPRLDFGSDSIALINWAAETMKNNITAVITKTGTFTFSYTDYNPSVVRLVSYAFLNKISQYYIELKSEKAKRDFVFATEKADSLRSVMNRKDQTLIAYDKKTMFTNPLQLQYKVPSENILADKQMIRIQYADAVRTQQEASYKLQKATPVIKILDKPDPPYTTSKKSALLFGIIGLIAGLFLFSLLTITPALIHYIKSEFNKFLHQKEQPASTTGS